MSKTSFKVEISESKPDVLIMLADKVLEKHLELNEKSPLNGCDMLKFAEKLSEVIAKRDQAIRLQEKAELLNHQASLSIGAGISQNVKTTGTVYSMLTNMMDIIISQNRNQGLKLADWGFDMVVSDGTNGKPGKPR